MSLLQLRKRLQELNKELEARCPDLLEEIHLVEKHIESRGKDSSHIYADAPGPWEAVSTCLDLEGDWKLTREQIIDAIIDGGYLEAKHRSTKAAAGRSILNDNMRYYLNPEKGPRLTLKGDKIGRPKE